MYSCPKRFAEDVVREIDHHQQSVEKPGQDEKVVDEDLLVDVEEVSCGVLSVDEGCCERSQGEKDSSLLPLKLILVRSRTHSSSRMEGLGLVNLISQSS